MNKHTRLLVVVLFAILILLAAAITMFYIDVNKDSKGSSTAVSDTAAYSDKKNKSHIFQDENGLYGLMDENGNIILEAEWTALSPIGNRCFMAKLQTRTQDLVGIIDNEGDIVVPFAYRNIEQLTDFLYAAQLDADGKYFFYDADFHLLLSEAWDEYARIDETLHLQKDGDTFIYGLGATLELIEVDLSRRIRPISFTLQIKDEQLLRIMNRSDWCDMADMLIAYLDAYRRDQLNALEDITSAARLAQVMNASETSFTWRGSAIDAISVFSEEADGIELLYCEMTLQVLDEEEVSGSADLQLTFAPDDTGKWQLYDVEFSQDEDSAG
ncbi:MAG: WG repeat-containing protein [Ruminococcus sp.]